MAGPEVVRRWRIFDGLTESERQRWLGRAASADVARGQTLARQGEPARHFYLLEAGFLKLLQLTADGTELIVRFIVPGDPFGGVVALSDAPYPVTAVAVQPSVALSWPRDTVAELLVETPQVRVNIMRELAMHMTAALTRVRELTTASVDQRLAHTILRLAEQCGRPDKDGVLSATADPPGDRRPHRYDALHRQPHAGEMGGARRRRDAAPDARSARHASSRPSPARTASSLPNGAGTRVPVSGRGVAGLPSRRARTRRRSSRRAAATATGRRWRATR